MSSTIADLTDGVTADTTDRIPIARTPFASGDNLHITPAYIRNYLLALANTWTATQTITPAVNTSAQVVSGFSLTGANAQSMVSWAGTLDTSGAPILHNFSVIDTQHGSDAKFFSYFGGAAGTTVLLNLNMNGVLRNGNIMASGGLYLYATGAQAISDDTGARNIVLDPGTFGPVLRTGFSYGWTSGDAAGAPDVTLHRDAADAMALRRGTNAQSSRVYGTFTDASNYERGALNAGADYIELAAETAGTGDDNMDVRLTPAGTGGVNFPGGVLLKTRAVLTNGAGASAGTLANAPSVGNPTKWIPIDDNGTTRHIPAW